MDSTLKRTWAEIDLDRLGHNLAVIRRQVGPEPALLGVVKADAYGHGAVPVARRLEELGAAYLAVSNIDEAEELRAGGVTLPILMLGFSPAQQSERILALDVTQGVPDIEIARAYSAAAARAGKRMRVHVKLDTGMGRLGFQCDDAHFAQSLDQIEELLHLPGLDAEGIFTHFAVADEEGAEAEAYTQAQYDRFLRMTEAAERRASYHFRLRHCCNAGAIANHPEWALDMVRCGIILYGAGELAERMGMEPVFSLKTTVSTVKEFEAGESISYGRIYTTPRKSRIAVLPVGYADGLHRALSGRIRVATPYGEAQQVGRICMDMCMIDVTDLPQVQSGDEVEIFGARMPVGAAAAAGGTISYELLCAVSKRVPRCYRTSGVPQA